MRYYIVEPGDTLGSIAQRLLGSRRRWRELAEFNDLDDPDRLRPGQKLQLPDSASPEPAVEPDISASSDDAAVSFSEVGNRVYAVDAASNEKFYLGRKFKLGLSRVGFFLPEDVLTANDPLIQQLQLSESEIRVLLPTAENEGALDAINTWDNSFLSFGMFQWTAGRDSASGELAALLARIKTHFAAEFERYWGHYGLGIEAVRGAYGWLTLQGARLESAAEKNQLRDYHWVLRFARAGADRRIQAAQALHAVNRLDGFYFRRQEVLDGYALAQLVNSEFGVSLLLDNHVNRPGYVLPTVVAGLREAQFTPAQLAAGSVEKERRFLHYYLVARETYGKYPMTHAHERAVVTQRYLANGRLSASRHSFWSNRDQRS